MRLTLASIAVALLAGTAYLLLWPVPIQPVAWQAPANPGLTGVFATNDRLRAARPLGIGAHEGPEDIAPGPDGHLYATTLDGTILRIDARGAHSVYANTGPRPLGIEMDGDGTLIVANAFRGLQRIARDGSVTDILTEVDGRPLVYANDLAIGADGTIYFSESSTRFAARPAGGTYDASLLDLLEHGGHGRVLEFRPSTGATRVIVDGLNFANGVAISADQQFLLIAETGTYRILKHWLRGPRTGSTEVVLDELPGFPDNINRGRDGRYWIGLVAPRVDFLDYASDKPALRRILQRLPQAFRPKAVPSSHVIAVSGDGDVLMDLQDPAARIPALTGVFETRDALYLSSLFGHEIGRLQKTDL
jgi:sugar lactone lactonase YvrE